METLIFSHTKETKHDYIKEKNDAFIEACKLYTEDLQYWTTIAIEKLTGNEKIRKLNKLYLNSTYCNNGWSFEMSELHYGPYRPYFYSGALWAERDQEIWQKLGIVQPFKEVQKQLAAKGYYLYDFTSKAVRTCTGKQVRTCDDEHAIYISTHKIEGNQLWHGLDVIPN